MRRGRLGLVAALLAACGRGGPDTGPTLDTGWFTEPPDPGCEDVALRTFPRPEQAGWYARNPPLVEVATEDRAAYAAELRDADGHLVPTTPTWTGLQLALRLDAPLAPRAAYTLRVSDCLGRHEVPFTTSALGEPLAIAPDALVGRAYAIDLAAARWEQPPGVGPLLSLYLDSAILVGVEWSTPTVLDLLGAQGFRDDLGALRQLPDAPTWDFPAADFTGAPYFEATAPTVRVAFDGAALTVHDFTLAATLAADGSALGGGWLSGLGDTRELAPVIPGASGPGAACELTSGFGVPCVACPDGQPYCLAVSARDTSGAWVPDLRVERR